MTPHIEASPSTITRMSNTGRNVLADFTSNIGFALDTLE
jgi:hypothetical protein